MGKFTKAIQKSKKEKRLATPKTKPVSQAPQQTGEPVKREAPPRKKLVIRSKKQPVESQKQIEKPIVPEKRMQKPAAEKPVSVPSGIDLSSIHSLLVDPKNIETPISSSEIEIEEKSPPFETPGMDLSEDTEKINVVYLDDDEIEVPEESSQPGLTEKELSTIHKMFEEGTTADKQKQKVERKTERPSLEPDRSAEEYEETSTEDQPAPVEQPIAEDEIPETENEQLFLDLNHSEEVEKQPEKKSPVIETPENNKVIPIIKKKSVKPLEQVADIQKDQTIDKKYEPPEVTLDNFKPANIDSNLVALLRPDSFEAEQFRMLRSNLMFPLEGKPPRIILVTGAVPGEGKSFIAANLAITFALDIQTHVLLIDCDIRKPHVHKRFGYQNVIGLSEYLTGKMDISSMLLNTNVSKLKLLPGGKPPKNPSELLSSKRMSNLLKEVKEKYPDRYIILDSPPPKLTAETNVLSRQVDGILLVAKYGRTRREDLVELICKLGKDKILGVIINWYNLRASRYYGYGKYGGYKYYYGKPDE